MSDPKQDRAGKQEWKPPEPNVEFFTSLSQDGKYVICKTVITAIKPRGYFETILQGPSYRASNRKGDASPGKAESTGS